MTVTVTGWWAAETPAGDEREEAVHRVGRLALAVHDPAPVLVEACRTLARLLPAGSAGVLQRDPGTRRLRLVAAVGRPAAAVGCYSVDDHDSLSGYTIRSGGPVIVDDLEADGRFPAEPLLLHCGLRSAVTAPLIGAGGVAHGVIGALAADGRLFSVDDAAFVNSMAAVVAGMLDRHDAGSGFSDWRPSC